jgi:hypothetical protein
MDSATQPRLQHGNGVHGTLPQGQQSLPPLSALTNGLPTAEQSPAQHKQQLDSREIRDSGNWSIAPSKHSSTVSQHMGLQVQTLLNPSDDSPSRASIPETPSSARYPSGFSHSSQVRQSSLVLPSRLTKQIRQTPCHLSTKALTTD